MSHSPERTEKVCLNCNAALIGRFCQTCGQENVEPRPSFWVLVSHFFEDITHFDGKFFKTVGTLVWHPGLLPAEYIRGRRATYLHPIRMYVFSSALLFLVFYSIVPGWLGRQAETVRLEIDKQEAQSDTLRLASASARLPNVGALLQSYDSTQGSLPAGQRDGWLSRLFTHRTIELTGKWKGDSAGIAAEFGNHFVHSMPYMLFLSLPLYALFLKLLYWRKNFNYTDHAVFLIYLYVFSFLIFLLLIGFSSVNRLPYVGWLHYLAYPVMVAGIVYTVIAMKRFYHDRTGAVLFRFFIFNVLSGCTLAVLFVLFVLLTIIRT